MINIIVGIQKTFLISFLLILFNVGVNAANLSAIVLSVVDGDTIKVKSDGVIFVVRLACIDSPEMKQPLGNQAKQRLQKLLPINSKVTLNILDTDRYGRRVAEVYQDQKYINDIMVKEGEAIIYPNYLSQCKNTKTQLIQSENYAKKQKLGFWNQNDPVFPWVSRQRNEDKKPNNLLTNTPNIANLPSCVNSDCDCSDFKTQEEAQRVFNAFSQDKFKLDRDHDGIPCESLP